MYIVIAVVLLITNEYLNSGSKGGCTCTRCTPPKSAPELLGLLYRRFYWLIDTKGMIELYRALIRPHLEYAVPVWAPHLAKDIDKLEKVQKFGLKICLKSWDNDYYDLLELADLPTLENRRMYLIKALCII